MFILGHVESIWFHKMDPFQHRRSQSNTPNQWGHSEFVNIPIQKARKKIRQTRTFGFIRISKGFGSWSHPHISSYEWSMSLSRQEQWEPIGKYRTPHSNVSRIPESP